MRRRGASDLYLLALGYLMLSCPCPRKLRPNIPVFQARTILCHVFISFILFLSFFLSLINFNFFFLSPSLDTSTLCGYILKRVGFVSFVFPLCLWYPVFFFFLFLFSQSFWSELKPYSTTNFFFSNLLVVHLLITK